MRRAGEKLFIDMAVSEPIFKIRETTTWFVLPSPQNGKRLPKKIIIIIITGNVHLYQ